MAVNDTAVNVLSDRVEVHLGTMDETPGTDRATASHTIHVFGDADLLDALAADLALAATALRLGAVSAPPAVEEKPKAKRSA